MAMKHGNTKLLLGLIILSVISILVLISIKNNSSSAKLKEDALSVVYFHNNICESCNEDARFINMFNSLTASDTKELTVNFKIYNIYLGDGDYMFEDYCRKYKIPEEDRLTPMVFIGDSYLVGESEIEESLYDIFIQEKDNLYKE